MKYLVSLILWPSLYFGGLLSTYFALSTSKPILWFNVVYLVFVALLVVFEHLMPHSADWLEPDGETINDIAHTLLTKGLVQVAGVIGASFPMVLAMVALPAVPAA